MVTSIFPHDLKPEQENLQQLPERNSVGLDLEGSYWKTPYLTKGFYTMTQKQKNTEFSWVSSRSNG